MTALTPNSRTVATIVAMVRVRWRMWKPFSLVARFGRSKGEVRGRL